MKERIRIARDTAIVFEYMHALGIAHRDIKSHNVLIDSHMNVKVCDFGLAKFVVSKQYSLINYILSIHYRLTLVKEQCSMQEHQLTWPPNYL